MLLLFAYICIVSPYIICFGVEFTSESILGIFDLLINVSFGLDIFLNFRTAYLGKYTATVGFDSFSDENNRPVVDRRQIAKNYAKTWLVIDVVSIIPFDELVTNQSLGFFKLFKVKHFVV